jgi:hypothetical protein
MKPKAIRDFRKTYQPYNKPCCFEGYRLAVLFDEKDEVKRIGARWDADEQIWWIPQDKLQNNDGNGPGTVHEWLNGHKMIMGPYGDFDYDSSGAKEFQRNIDEEQYEEFQLSKKSKSHTMRIYLSYDIAHEFSNTGDSGNYMHRERGRKRWEELVKEGYNRTINA